jgi:hypothetical protein
MPFWGFLPGRLRVLLVATPKTGNVWLRSLLSEVYRLPVRDVSGDEFELPRVSRRRYVGQQHYMPRTELLEWGARAGITFVTLLRHPADVFVSYYHHVNRRASFITRNGVHPGNPAFGMIGESLDSPAVLGYLETDFKKALGRSIAWAESGRALVVRYEDLHQSPVETLATLTDDIYPVRRARLESAVSMCHIDTMRRRGGRFRQHCRRGVVDGWRDELGPTHLEIFRTVYAQEFARLGYSLDA